MMMHLAFVEHDNENSILESWPELLIDERIQTPCPSLFILSKHSCAPRQKNMGKDNAITAIQKDFDMVYTKRKIMTELF